MRLPLHPHRDTPYPAVTGLAVELARPAAEHIDLTWELTGDIAAIRWPAPAAAVRTDGLWRHTCFEAFLRPEPGEGYVEFNLSPSTAWAAYRFDRYRSGMRAVEPIATPEIALAAAGDRAVLTATLAFKGLTDLPLHAPWRLALSAVIEDRQGGLSYWALAHPPGRPDFHHADGFAATLVPCTA